MFLLSFFFFVVVVVSRMIRNKYSWHAFPFNVLYVFVFLANFSSLGLSGTAMAAQHPPQ